MASGGVLALFLGGVCHGALPKSVTQPKGRQKTFLDNSVARAVGYSFMDVYDYEDDSSDRGLLLTIMPNYEQYLWEKDVK